MNWLFGRIRKSKMGSDAACELNWCQMKYVCFLILLLAASACRQQNPTAGLLTPALPDGRMACQKRIVGDLSGANPLGNGDFLASRWSPAERSLARAYLKELIGTLGLDAREQMYTSPNLNPAIDLILEPFRGTNIYGILPATGTSTSYLVLGAHYDSGKRNAPGAVDNATGIALVYAVVRELSRQPVRNRNIVLVFFDQEEEELIGSKAFVRLMQKEDWDVHSVHCFDMVGWDADGDRAMEVFSADETLLAAYRTASQDLGHPLKEIRINPVGYDNNATDFDAFVPAGYPVIGAGECYYHKDSTPYKDTPADTFETVDFNYLLSCTNRVATILENLSTK